MSRNTSSNAGAAGCGYLIVLVLIGWAVIVLLPYIIAGLIACLVVWLLVRYHREAWLVLQLARRLFGWIVLGAFMVARWILVQAGNRVAQRCQQPPAPMPGPPLLPPPPAQNTPSASHTIPVRTHPGWKLKPPGRPP